MVVNAPTSNIVSAAELAIAHLLGLARHLPDAHASLKAGEWKRSRFTGVELYEKTVGVVGLGRIGTLVAQRLAAVRRHARRLRPLRHAGARAAARRAAAEPRRADAGLRLHHRAHPEDAGDDRPDRRPGVRDRQARAADRQREPRRHHRRGRARARARRGPDRRRRARRVRLRAAEEPVADRAAEPAGHAAPRRLHRRGAGEGGRRGRAAACGSRSTASSCPTRSTSPAASSTPYVRPGIPLTEKLGQVFAALADGPIASLDVEVRGDLNEYDVSVLKLAALKGLFVRTLTENVSYVNAPLFAEERGIQVRLITDPIERRLPQRHHAEGRDDHRRDPLRLRHAHRPEADREAHRGRGLRRRGAARGPPRRLHLHGPARHRRRSTAPRSARPA